MRTLIVVLAALSLAACEPTEKQKARVRGALPPECSLVDLGSYGDVDDLVVVTCGGRQARTLHYRYSRPQGRQTRWFNVAVVQIEGEGR